MTGLFLTFVCCPVNRHWTYQARIGLLLPVMFRWPPCQKPLCEARSHKWSPKRVPLRIDVMAGWMLFSQQYQVAEGHIGCYS